jgi:AraC-like DNA-binding protein
MKVLRPIPAEKISDYVEDILVIEQCKVTTAFVLPLFANGKPTLLFQTAAGTIRNNANHLTLFGQTILPDTITIREDFTLIAYFFKPFALTTLFGFSAAELTDNPIQLNLLDQRTTEVLLDQLLLAPNTDQMRNILDKYILSLITKVNTDISLISYATRLIAKNPSGNILPKVQNELYITERSFQRLFERQVGISPSQYRRVAQFNAAFQQLNRRKFKQIGDVAFDNFYADQSHFIRTFKEFTNLTPTEYLDFSEAG